ncbi:MAG: M20/M25/M40 family metallo-hydrolase [Bdellovibrionales bacterium]|nr:M20/M25/M40 family metallo-hydrolase [Bdellovibrionales bacterium]
MSITSKIQSLTDDLVRIPSESGDKQACFRVLKYVEHLFEGTSYIVQWFEHNGSPSLCISKKKTLTFSFILCGHLDVVPADDTQYVPHIDGDRLYGRGAADMKGSCAVMIELMRNHEHSRFFEDVGLVLTTDEEIGGDDGVGYLVSLGLSAPTVFVPDGGEPLTPCVFEKGDVSFSLEVEGVPAHGARPWLGVNAIERLMDDLAAIRSHFPPVEPPNEWGTTCNIGIVSGGSAVNSVAAHAQCQINMRHGEDTNAEKLLEELRGLVSYASVTQMSVTPVVKVNESSDTYQLFSSLLEKNGGSSLGVKEHGACDACFFVGVAENILITKPESSPFHVVDEWVSLSSLEALYHALDEFARTYLSMNLELPFP